MGQAWQRSVGNSSVCVALIGTMILIMVKRVEYQQQQLALAK
jgi:hypothetical protein